MCPESPFYPAAGGGPEGTFCDVRPAAYRAISRRPPVSHSLESCFSRPLNSSKSSSNDRMISVVRGMSEEIQRSDLDSRREHPVPGAQARVCRGRELLPATLRGVGPEFGTSSGKPRVAFNLDGVYLPRSTTSSAIMSDLERIEVLRGPQGTCMDATCIKQYAELAPGERVVIMCLATDRAHGRTLHARAAARVDPTRLRPRRPPASVGLRRPSETPPRTLACVSILRSLDDGLQEVVDDFWLTAVTPTFLPARTSSQIMRAPM